ncbi:MAG: hypothetical protein IKZ00_00920 [Bacteroidaceae bacterium]|nr:hypothetical protein [Bacteroidaceae bacterium]
MGKREAHEETERTKHEYCKQLVAFCTINGVAWVWCSYILAYLGRTQIAEDLSKIAVTEIVAVVLVYALKSLFENLSKHNTWPDRKKAAVEPEETV